jgi:hypothetical protein
MPRSHRPEPPTGPRRHAAGVLRRTLLLALLVLLPAGSATAYWSPPQHATWQWQLSGVVDPSVTAQVYDVDGFDTPASTVASLRAGGRRTVCYFSAGSYEDWRPDAAAFPAAVLGSTNGWPGERWLDIRRLDLLGPIMTARMTMCRDKGFDAVEPDNVDGYANATGFPLTGADQLAFNRMIAATARGLGLSVGLKNDLDQVTALQPDFDFAVNEECFAFGECGALAPFTAAGKAVFNAEYTGQSAVFCPTANALGFSSIKKRLALDPWLESCLPLTAPPLPDPPATTPPANPIAPASHPSAPVPPPAGPSIAPPPVRPHRVVARAYRCRGRAVRFTVAGRRYAVACTGATRVRRIVAERPRVVVTYVVTIRPAR